MPSLQNKVVVITGASSGLGRATAHAFARKGAKLALAARHTEELTHVAHECSALGNEVLAIETDVSVEADVQRLAKDTVAAFGSLDVWVNNAGVTYFAPLESGDMEEHRGVIETNVFGYIYGARAVLPIFRNQGRGTLINISSVLGRVGHPFVPSYVVSKFADHGLTEALRAELADFPDIHICTVLPFAIDTPHFMVADNELGRRPKPIPPVQSPEKVARAVVRMAAHPRHERYIPRFIRAGVALKYLFPATTDQVLLHVLQRYHLGPQAPVQKGNALSPGKIQDAVHGNAYEQSATFPQVAAFALVDALRVQQRMIRRRIARLARRAA